MGLDCTESRLWLGAAAGEINVEWAPSADEGEEEKLRVGEVTPGEERGVEASTHGLLIVLEGGKDCLFAERGTLQSRSWCWASWLQRE